MHALVKHQNTLPPFSSSQSFILSNLAAEASDSLMVSSLPTAHNASTPLPIDETSLPSTVTEADLTRCKMTNFRQWFLALEQRDTRSLLPFIADCSLRKSRNGIGGKGVFAYGQKRRGLLQIECRLN